MNPASMDDLWTNIVWCVRDMGHPCMTVGTGTSIEADCYCLWMVYGDQYNLDFHV